MGYGLMQAGQQFKSDAKRGLSDVSRMEQQRNQSNDAIDRAEKQQRASNVGMGAATGAMAGAQAGSVGGPWGAVIGAGIGLLASYL